MIGALLLLGIPTFALFKKHRNPHWTPFSTLFATPRELNAALERVRITSVPTPHVLSALDPGMSSEHVKSVNVVLTSETDHGKIASEAKKAKSLGFHNTSKALDAKASAVGQAKAKGATDVDIHKEQLAAQTSQPPTAAATHAAGWDGYGLGERHHHHGWGGGGDQWGQQWGYPQHHHHHRHHEQDEFGGEEMDPRMLQWLMMMMQQQQHPHHRHHHHHHEQFGGDFETRGPHPHAGHFGHHHGFGYGGAIDPMMFYPQDDMMMPDDGGLFAAGALVAHPHGAFVVPPHGGGGHGGGHFGHHHGFGGGYGGFGYPIDPMLLYPQVDPDMMMLDDDGGF